MDLLSLLKKEALTVRRNLGLFLVLLVIVPAALAFGTSVYQQTIPEDIPVGVAPASAETTETDLQLVRGGVQFFATPVEYESRSAAVRDLHREQVYLVFVVPPGLTDENASVNVTVVTDRANAPLRDPTNLTLDLLEAQFDRFMPADVSIERERVGTGRSFAEFMLPSALFGLIVIYALVYLPYQVREERRVLDRLRTETRLGYVVGSKLAFYGALVVVPAATVTATSRYLGYGFGALAPATLGVLALTFLYLATAGLAVLFFLRLRQAAVFVNLGLAVGGLVLSGMVYPVGFYSATRKAISRSLPTHYSLITLRSTMLRETPLSMYSDYLLWLAGTFVAAAFVLAVGLVAYDRGGVYE